MLRRTVLPRIVVILSLTAPLPAAPAAGNAPFLTHPDGMWSLRLDLPGYQIKPPRVLRDRSRAWVLAASGQKGVSLTVFVETQTKFRQTSECREVDLKKPSATKRKTTSSAYQGWAIAEDMPDEKAAAQATQRRILHAYLYHEGFCIDVELTKDPYRPEDRDLLLKTLDGLSAVEASREEMARAASYVPLSGPDEQIAIEAAQRMRAKDFAAAEALLLPLCPDARRQAPEGRSLPDCALRNAGLAEARNVNQGRDLATLYWRAGDLLAKDGRPDAAIEVLRKGLDIQPDHADLWYATGMAERDRKDFANAAAALNRSLLLRPNDARTMLGLAANLMDQGKLVEADAMLDRVLKADPKEKQVWLRRGEILMQRGHYDEAIAIFQKAQSLGVDQNTVRDKIKACKDALASQKLPS